MHISFRNIFNIWRNDAKRIFSSVVAVVILFGLCVVPCLYAWFNIFSNWDPYGPSATSRIRVAVASEDKGADILGLQLNVGQKVMDGLAANDAIGWVFVDSEDEVYRRVDSADCYAGLVVPESFTEDVLSFIVLDFEHPEIVYYENEKKNAIAPKITGKAKTAVQEQVNATFVETIASVIGNVLEVLDANGVDYEGTVANLCDKTKSLSVKLEEVEGLLGSSCRLLDATEGLMYNTGTLSANVADVSYRSAHLSNTLASDAQLLNSQAESTYAQLKSQLISEDETLASVDAVLSSPNASDAEKAAAKERLKQYTDQHSGEMTEDFRRMVQAYLDGDRDLTREQLFIGLIEYRRVVLTRLYSSTLGLSESMSGNLGSLQSAATNAGTAFSGAGDTASNLSVILFDTMGPLNTLEQNLYDTRKDIMNARIELETISETLETLRDSEYLKSLSESMLTNSDEIAPYFASPIKMDTFVMYPIENYGSAMSPFYTVLAQYVGALFSAALLKARVRKEHQPDNLNMPEEFFGRYGLFFTVSMIQAIVTSLGDLYYIGIYCLHPGYFVLSACVTGLCFSMINYALLFSLEKIGLGASVIIMVLQVAGSGGSYPVDVVPKVFQVLYPFMPFNYAMNAMRECIAGTYGSNLGRDLIMLLVITLVFLVLGLALYYPMRWLNNLINESARKSEIML